MLKRITDNLHRQKKGLALLQTLLEEEFSCLQHRDPRAVAGIEFSIQELLRQLAMEREILLTLVREMTGEDVRLSSVLEQFPAEEGERVRVLLQEIDIQERSCAAQAGTNAEIAIGVTEQNRSLIAYLQKELRPKNENTYSRRGRFADPGSAPSMIRGRL
ncbi:MAG: flagellar protein FlgN [Desulfovibrionales bacterium]